MEPLAPNAISYDTRPATYYTNDWLLHIKSGTVLDCFLASIIVNNIGRQGFHLKSCQGKRHCKNLRNVTFLRLNRQFNRLWQIFDQEKSDGKDGELSRTLLSHVEQETLINRTKYVQHVENSVKFATSNQIDNFTLNRSKSPVGKLTIHFWWQNLVDTFFQDRFEILEIHWLIRCELIMKCWIRLVVILLMQWIPLQILDY